MGLAEEMAQKHVRIMQADEPIKAFEFAVKGGKTFTGILAYEHSPYIQGLTKFDPQELAAKTLWQGTLGGIVSRTDLQRDPARPLHAPVCR